MIYTEIASGEKKVFLLGSYHSDNREQLELIRRTIEEFNPDVVLVEGAFSEATFDSVEDSIKRGGEMGYASFISGKKSICVRSNDPLIMEAKKFLENKYGARCGELYFLLRGFSSGVGGEDWERIRVLLGEVLNEDFHESKKYSEYFDPTISKNLFNKITRELNVFRDEYMLNEISRLLKKHSKIFVIKGDYHLESYFEKIRSVVRGS